MPGEYSFVPSWSRVAGPASSWRVIGRDFRFDGRSETIKSLVLISKSPASVKREKVQKYSIFQ